MSLLRSLPGRLILISGSLFALLFLVGRFTVLPEGVEVARRIAVILSLVGVVWLAGAAVMRSRRALLWRVRRKLILSYLFLGAVPLMLVAAFVLAGGMLLYMTVATYVFNEGYANTIDDVRQIAETSAVEIGRRAGDVKDAIDRKVESLETTYPNLSIAVVPVSGEESASSRSRLATVTGGPWTHSPPPASAPPWVVRAKGFAGTVVVDAPGSPIGPLLVMRAAVPTRDGTRMVVADLPVDGTIVTRLHDRTGARLESVSASSCGVAETSVVPSNRNVAALFREAVAFMDCTTWADGSTGNVAAALQAPLGDLSSRLASVRSAEIAQTVGDSWWAVFVQFLVLLAVLFLIIQGAAIVMGAALAKSITSAVHELFVGTERIQQGDFAHRISIESRDQLGDLADSFNRMSASIEHLLRVERDKHRLDEELRIARAIQQSLLPERPPAIAGLDIADLCEPAREVGGDYYDFFELGPRQLGVLIADVSGKGTSAALYMAVVKGLMLALSHNELSPRRLLIDVNRQLAEHLDNRSFITMTYAVIDLDRWTLRVARAGHTPLIAVSNRQAEFVQPDGMVVGLRLPGAGARFEEMLTEYERPLRAGELIVLYTDGITEAMDDGGELFGDLALARVLASHGDRDAAGIREAVLSEIRGFVRDAEPHDDMTMVVLKVKPEADERHADVA